MGLVEYYAMAREWASHPPVAWMIAAYLGIEPQQEPEPDDGSIDGLREYAMAAGLLVIGG